MSQPLALPNGTDYGARTTFLPIQAPTLTDGRGSTMSNADRRFTYRLDLPEDRVRLYAPSVGRVVVADLSASGSGLIVNPDDFGRVGTEPATFELHTGESFSVKLDPVRVTKVDQQLRVGARFLGLPVAGMRVLSQFLIREFLEENNTLERLLEDPRTLTTRSATFIRRHLRRSLLAEARPLRVYSQGKILPISILGVRFLEARGQKVIEARATREGLEEGKSYSFVVAQSGSVTHFSARVEHRSDTTLYIAVPEELHQAGFRESIRAGLPTSGRALLVCPHPRLPDELITRPLLDLSARGFAFESDPESDLLFPGDRLTRLQVHFADEVYEGSGVIRSVAPHHGSDRYSCGVEILEFGGAELERRWRERVFKHAHPRAVVTEARAAARQAWQVLDASGYVGMWTRPANRDRLEAAYSRSWSHAGQDVGRLMLVENRGETVGTLAGSLLYPRTWLVHQLGVAERERSGAGMFLDLAHELYAGLMYLFQHQASANYFAIFAERDKPWTQTLYADFVAQCPDRSAFAYTENRVFRRSVTAPGSRRVSRKKSVRIVAANAGHLDLISRALEASCSPVECDALSYSRSEIALEHFSEACRARGSERDRQLWVAVEAGVPKAALLAESGCEGVNIFGLLNRCKIVPLCPEPVAPDTTAALLDQASEHFARLGKEEFLFFDRPSASVEELSLLGLEFISDGMRFIASKQVVPAWLSYLKNVLSLRATSEGGNRA